MTTDTPHRHRPPTCNIPPAAVGAWNRLTLAVLDGDPPPCADHPETWWNPATVDAAVAACRSCEYLAPCTSYAAAADERDGIWGGIDQSSRRRERRTTTTKGTP